ncbi:MAG: GNAT family N-acetyltransferase [Tannerellaceae bacterium]|nr:GNAT family N-acetyltransferase [Tannerellaceae bacterium]
MITVNEDIQLTPAILADAKDIFQAIDQNRESLRIWLPFVDHTHKQEDTENALRSFTEDTQIVRAIQYKGNFAGLIGLKNPDQANAKVEIGYWIIPAMEGKGLVTRSCRSLIEYAFNEMNMNRILIQVCTENHKSRRIPERLGFTEEGIERDGELLVSGYSDVVRYGLLKREYNGSN